jgi:predicted RNA methylase
MLLNICKKIKQGIKQHGFSHFVVLNVTEQYYKFKFKKLSVDYSEGIVSMDTLNSVSTNKDSKINQASPFYELKTAFAFTGIKYSDICLLDIGCGNGKVLNFGMMLHFKKVMGIDLDSSAIEKAIANCNQMKKNGYSSIFEVLLADATKFQIPDGINVIYLFNPFGARTMQFLVENIIQYQKKNKKDLYVVYCVAVHKDLFKANYGFIKVFERLGGDKTKSEMAIFRVAQH